MNVYVLEVFSTLLLVQLPKAANSIISNAAVILVVCFFIGLFYLFE